MFANKIMIWAFKQSPEVHNAVPMYKYLMQMGKKNGPRNFGQFAGIFQRREGNFSSSYLIHLQTAKEIGEVSCQPAGRRLFGLLPAGCH